MIERGPLTSSERAVMIRVRVKPNSREDSIEGVDEHHNALVVRVKGKAVEGRANRDLIGFLEEKLNLKELTIIKGHRSRMKLLVYETDDPEGEIERLKGTVPGIRE